MKLYCLVTISFYSFVYTQMSYEITYRKAVFKTSKGLVIPLIEVGSNNVYDISHNGKERRSRDWNFSFKLAWGREVVERYMKDSMQRYIDEDGYVNSKGESDGSYREVTEQTRKDQNTQWYLSWRFPGKGTVWSAISYLSNVNIDDDIAQEYLKVRVSSPRDDRHSPLDEPWVYTIDEFDRQKYIDAKKWWACMCCVEIIGIRDALYQMKIRRNKKRNENRENRKPVKKDWYVTINWSPIYKMGRRNIYTTRSKDSAKGFTTEKAAHKWIKDRRLAERWSWKFLVCNRSDATLPTGQWL